jgi:hypothetical protein
MVVYEEVEVLLSIFLTLSEDEVSRYLHTVAALKVNLHPYRASCVKQLEN